MCCIAVQPAGDPAIDKDTLAHMWDKNHDGAGYMFSHDKKLIVRKPFFKLADLRDAYAADHAAHGGASNFVLHFRFSTHGKKDELNTHPHILAGGRAALVHNGILNDFTPGWKSDVSDTVVFCAQVLAYRQPSQLTSAKFGRYLGAMIGDSNKLAIMDYTGKVQIVNEKQGVWDGARWYSNTGYRPAVTLPPGTGIGISCCASNLPVRYQPSLWDHPASEFDRQDDERAQWAAAGEDRYEDQYDAAYDLAWSDNFSDLADAAALAGGPIDWKAIEQKANDMTDDQMWMWEADMALADMPLA